MEISKEQALLSKILSRAWDDESFKKQLIDDPVNAIENLTGQKIRVPEGKKLIVMDQTSSSEIYINIPPKPEMEDVELNEDELDIIAGGGSTAPKLGDPANAFDGLLDG